MDDRTSSELSALSTLTSAGFGNLKTSPRRPPPIWPSLNFSARKRESAHPPGTAKSNNNKQGQDVELSGGWAFPAGPLRSPIALEEAKGTRAASCSPHATTPRITPPSSHGAMTTLHGQVPCVSRSYRSHTFDSIMSADFHVNSSSPRFLRRVSEAAVSMLRAGNSPTVVSRRFSDPIPAISPSYAESLRACSSGNRSQLSGRANIGEVVQEESKEMNLLLAVETSIFNTMNDPKLAARPLTCQLTPDDYTTTHKVFLLKTSLSYLCSA
jgi:hypothetical protein